MFLKNKIKLLIIFLSIIIFSSSATSNNIKIQAQKARFWENIFIDQVRNFKYYSKEIDYLVYNIQKDLLEFNALANDFDTRYHQLRFILGSIINNPYEFRLVISELNSGERAFLKLYSQLKILDNQAATYIRTLNEMEQDLQYLTKTKYSDVRLLAASTRLNFNINILQDHLKLERKKMNTSLSDMKELIDKFTSMSEFLNASFIKQLYSYFFIPGATLWKMDLGKLLPYSLESWFSGIPATLKEKFPNDTQDYIEVGIILAIAVIIYLIFHYLLIKKINIRAKIPDAYELLLRALAAFFLFIGLFATSSVLIFPETVLFYRLGVVIFGFFAWFFSLALKVIQSPSTKHDSTITTLFIIFSCGVLFQIFAMNYVILAIIWPIVLILSLAYQLIININKQDSFKNSYLWIFILVSIVFIILSLTGYIYLSIFSCMIWFLLLVIFKLGTAFTWLLKAAMDKNNFKKSFIRVVVLGVGVPIIWLILIFLVVVWASMQINSNLYSFLDYFSKLEFKYEQYDIKLSSILLLIFLFFVFKNTIKCFTIFLSYSSYAKQNQQQRHQLLPSIKTLSKYTGWILYIILLMALLRINITSILVILGGLSVGIGFGLQDIVNNFIAGLIIMFGKACRPGDIIEIDSLWGTIQKTDIRTTTMRTFENCIITIPNSMLINKQLHNWTKNNDLIRKDIDIGVGYDSDVEKVEKLLLEIAENFDEVCKAPAPQVIFKEFGNSALIFRLRIWLHVIDNIVATPSAIRYCINKTFKENDINIAYPQMDLHIKEIPSNKNLPYPKN